MSGKLEKTNESYALAKIIGIRLSEILYKKYKKLAEYEETNNHVFFVGRLANYKYFNMDEAIANALQFFNEKLMNTVK